MIDTSTIDTIYWGGIPFEGLDVRHWFQCPEDAPAESTTVSEMVTTTVTTSKEVVA